MDIIDITVVGMSPIFEGKLLFSGPMVAMLVTRTVRMPTGINGFRFDENRRRRMVHTR